MIVIEANAAAFMAQLDEAIADIDRQVDEAYFNWTIRIFYDQVSLYPQWSGDAAANWIYSINSPSGEYRRTLAKDHYWDPKGYALIEPLQRGDFAAVSAAMSRALDGPRPSYTDTVYFVNNTPIAAVLEENPAWVRSVNLVNGAIALPSFIADKWKNLPYDATYFTFP